MRLSVAKGIASRRGAENREAIVRARRQSAGFRRKGERARGSSRWLVLALCDTLASGDEQGRGRWPSFEQVSSDRFPTTPLRLMPPPAADPEWVTRLRATLRGILPKRRRNR